MLVRQIAWREPAELFGVLAAERHLAWLDSASAPASRARFSYLALDPFQVLQSDAGGTTLDGRRLTLDPFAALHGAMARFAGGDKAAPVPFAGGAIGFLGYELAPHLEQLPRHKSGALGIPDLWFGFYDLLLAFDHAERRAWLLASGLPLAGAAAHDRAARRLAWLQQRIDRPASPIAPPPPLAWRAETGRARYLSDLSRVLDYISAGDIYQANYTTRFLAPAPAGLSAAAVHAAIRRAAPAPFGAFLDCGSFVLASASPERFLQLSADGRIESRPIKGTRPRGATPEADAALRAALQASEKDRAENLMIVDLLRNDIGRVAEIGSVRVPQLLEVETFSRVHHLVSAVEGRLRPGLGPVDLLRAAFPGGSVTGAPKIRAMQIIAELEHAARGPYCGSVAWIGWDGAMDSSIVIRTAVVTPRTVVVQAGGGVVADSDPQAEWSEMLDKARPLLCALGPEPPP